MSDNKRSISARDRMVETSAGALFFGALIVLGLFTIVFSRTALFGAEHTVKFSFVNTGGLSKGDKVTVRGMPVGKIDAMELADGGTRIVVTAKLQQPLTFHEGYVCEIRASSMLGGNNIYLELGPDDAPTVTADILDGQSPIDPFREIQAAATEIKAFTADLRNADGTLNKLIHDDGLYNEAKQTMASVSEAGTKVGEAMEELKQAGESLQAKIDGAGEAIENMRKAGEEIAKAGESIQALSGDGKEMIASAKETMDSAQVTLDNINGAVTDARDGKGTLGKLLTDEALYDDAKTLMADLGKAADRFGSEDSTISRLAADNGELYASIKGSFDSMNDTMTIARELAEKVQRGEGTLGKLIVDESLYNDTRNTVKEVQGAVSDFREQAPVLTFGSFVFGAL